MLRTENNPILILLAYLYLLLSSFFSYTMHSLSITLIPAAKPLRPPTKEQLACNIQ